MKHERNEGADYATKLGVRIGKATGELQDLLAARPAVAKFVGGRHLVSKVPSGVLLVGREPWDGDVVARYRDGESPRQAAAEFVTAQLDVYRANPAVKHWEGPNAPRWESAAGMSWYAAFEVERVQRMAELGLRCVIGNFAAGSPPLSFWPAFFPALEEGLEHKALLGLQETSCPWMWWLTGRQQPDGEDDQGDTGWLTLRYRKIYRQYLLPRELRVPLVITRCGIDPTVVPRAHRSPPSAWRGLGDYWREHDGEPDAAGYYFRQLLWYDEELRKDDYVVGATLFTWGARDAAEAEFDVTGTPVAQHLIAEALAHPAHPFDYDRYVGGEGVALVPPRVPYERTYVLLPHIKDPVELMEWRTAAVLGSAGKLRTVGHSADDAGVGPRDREVVAVNPGAWGEDLHAWYERHYPNVRFHTVESSSPWEMAVQLLPPLEEDIALAQIDPRWADYDFGEHPDDPSVDSIGRYGCFLTALAIILRKHYGRAVTPPLLDKLLVAARAGYHNDNYMNWSGVVPLFPAFDDSIKDQVRRSARELAQLQAEGWEIVLRRADGGHFVYLEGVEGETLLVIDTWDGERKRRNAGHYRGIRAARLRQGEGEGANLRVSAVLDGTPPRTAYRRTYVLLPQIEDVVERLEWRTAAALGSAGERRTVGHSADDAGVGPRDREVVAVNPGAWGDDLRAWYERHYPGARFHPIETTSPWEMAVQLLPPLEEDIALAQQDPRWAGYDFGEHPDDPSVDSIGRYGCFLTALAIILRKHYGRAVTPPFLDKLLVAARAGYHNDNYMNWPGVVPLFPAFDAQVKDQVRRSARELAQLQRAGWEIVLRRADGGHFVYLEGVEGETLVVIDTWDGERKRRNAGHYRGIRAAHLRSPAGPSAGALPVKVAVGLHDDSGGEWMVNRGVKGLCLVHHEVHRQPVPLDYRRLREAGLTVIARLNWGYAGGAGTLPRPENREAFADAVAQTMVGARGVDYFHVGNEPNNRSEWPGFNSPSEFALSPHYVTELYNAVWDRVAGQARLGPPPIDPYFGPGSNNRDWWVHILEGILGADALFLHAKTQTNDPAEVRSRARFGDHPLTWQYLHLRTVETSLAVVPSRFAGLPVFVTELNPQCVDTMGGRTGWLPQNGSWVHEALDFFRKERPVDGVVFYRFERAGDQAPFGLEDKPALLEAIEREAMG